ncbi:hypothetical protein DICPUDRAFT_151469 [Dictyostelium purpureum]|uniref:Uncharacterized protein n=1 Tax=Dictyostelium purpureum TaxID=5786 RepID=F0ZIX8_DICPU|nr:uncharacterized protein DICPUDRAFT_151469 [Dictyostelium purpureum]EGC36119.1 hypothetical protein DICPUDRAFT_151469 [Dictyostelium purpureum]|eukprot:XP_003287376.1 hypothetical protein DICPUDRAFT_151469 [Dictyostelium purpureum]
MYDKDFFRQFKDYYLKKELYGSNPPLNRYQHTLANDAYSVPQAEQINNSTLINSVNNNNYIPNNQIYHKSNNVSIQQNLNDNLVSQMGLDSIIPYNISKCPFWISWSPDNSYLALSTNDSVDIFEPNSGELLYSIKDHRQVVSMVLWLNEGHGEVENVNNIYNKSKTVILRNQFNEDYKVPGEIKSKTSQSKYRNSLISPYSSFLSCSLDHSINIYRNFELVTSLTEHDDWLKSMAVTSDSTFLLSGCASSTICGWDLTRGSVRFKIEKAHPASDSTGNLNTVNSLKFSNFNSNVFASGSRYGTMRLWDIREGFKTPLFSIQAHNKLNLLHFTKDDRHILTSGRDNAIRLWDIRALVSSPSTKVVGLSGSYENPSESNSTGGSNDHTKIGIVREYRKHKCVGYNIGCSFINNDRQIVSGSEDQQVYIYDTDSGEVVKKIASHRSPVHLVPVCNGGSEMRIATSSIDACDIHIYSPQIIESDEKLTYANKYLGIRAPKEEDVIPQIKVAPYLQRVTMESLMQRFGDRLFQFYHKNRISPSETTNHEEFTDLNKLIEEEFKTQLFAEARKIARKLNLTDREFVDLIARNASIDDPSFFDKTIDDDKIERDGTIDEKQFGPLVQHLTHLNADGGSLYSFSDDDFSGSDISEDNVDDSEENVDDSDDSQSVGFNLIEENGNINISDFSNSDSGDEEYFSAEEESKEFGKTFKFNFNFSDKNNNNNNNNNNNSSDDDSS